MTRTSRAILGIAIFIAPLAVLTPLLAQSPVLDDELRRIFQTNDYAARSFGPADWFDPGAPSGVDERPGEGGPQQLAEYDAASARRTVIADAALLTPAGAAAPLPIAGSAWTADRKRGLIFTNTRPVWRQNTRGDYWLVDRDARWLRKLGGNAPEASLMFAKLSPDGQRVAYVHDRNLFVETVSTGDIHQLTTDGSQTVVNGTADWVNEEELDLRDGFRWSPDGRSLAYWQFDTSGVESFTLVNDTAALYPTITRFPYPKPGTTNSSVRIGVIAASGGETRWLKTPGEPRNTYLATLQWTKDSRSLLIQQLNRLQNTNDLLLADARDGNVRRIYRDTNAAWVDHVDRMLEIGDAAAVTWLSEQDGWRHLYRVALDGSGARLITRFDGDIIDLDGLDLRNGWAYFGASPMSATERFLYRARLDGDGTVERVTPPDSRGTHTYQLSPNGRWAIHTASRVDVPPTVDLVELTANRVVRTMADNALLAAKAAPLLSPPTEFVKVDIGNGVVLDGSVIKPRAFDATKKYPGDQYAVYGRARITDRRRSVCRAAAANSFTGHSPTRAMSLSAWITAVRRHQEVQRGVKVVYGAVGELSASGNRPPQCGRWSRRTRISMRPVSACGAGAAAALNTLNCMAFRYPDVFSVGVAVAPVPRISDSTIRFIRSATWAFRRTTREGYRVGSPINFAEGLKGRLLVVHGSGDDNVHFQGTERLINRLVELGKPFDVMVYPNRTHAIAEGTGTSLHVQTLIARYFLEHLPPGARNSAP